MYKLHRARAYARRGARGRARCMLYTCSCVRRIYGHLLRQELIFYIGFAPLGVRFNVVPFCIQALARLHRARAHDAFCIRFHIRGNYISISWDQKKYVCMWLSAVVVVVAGPSLPFGNAHVAKRRARAWRNNGAVRSASRCGTPSGGTSGRKGQTSKGRK